jgi:hypothetical protein
MSLRSEDVSIYQHILAHVPSDGPGLLEGGDVLPDEPEREPGDIGFAPGLLDEVLEPGSAVSSERTAAASFRLIEAVMREPSEPERYDELLEDLRTNDLLGFLDPLIARVYQAGFSRDAVRELALRLTTRSGDRIPVKVGIALLGLCAKEEDRPILLTLGRHEEFTHYVGVTLTHAFDDPEPLLWELAKAVQDWGRINMVRQLAETGSPEIKAWILREGCHIDLIGGELAYLGATAGELVAELRADEIDDALYLAAGRILSKLIEARPYDSQDIDDYENGPEAIRLFLSHVSRREERLETFEPIAAIVDFLELRDGIDDPFNGERRRKESLPAGWADDERVRTATFARWILQRPAWRRAIDEGLRSADHWTFALAEEAARWLGDNTVPLMVARLREHPDDDHTWFEVAKLADEEQFEELVEMARDRVEVHEPDDEQWRPNWTIGIHQEVERFPDKGWPLFRAQLESPILRDRHWGLGGLERVVDGHWPDEADAIVEAIARSDPDEEIRTRARDLLSRKAKGGSDASSPPPPSSSLRSIHGAEDVGGNR